MRTIIYIACLLLAYGSTTRAFARKGDLTEPHLAFPVGFSEAARTNIMAALRRSDCRFLGGHFVNSNTTLRYGGDTRALNLFVEGLSKCPGVKVSVSFQTEGAPSDCDWFVLHLGVKPGEFTVYVNLKSPRIKREGIVIPKSEDPLKPKVK